MKQLSVLIKPASSLCNIKCKYCFYNDISSLREVVSYGVMSDEVMKKMIDNIYVDLNDGDILTVAFQGGEPTFAGIEYYKNFIEYSNKQEKQVTVNYAIQTNGIIIDESWCELFKENNFLVGISIDGPREYHDVLRLTRKNEGTYDKVINAKNLLAKYGIDFNVLSVLSKPLTTSPKDVWRFIADEGIDYVQFIPCLEDFNLCDSHKYALDPRDFSSFYIELYSLWKESLSKGKYVSVKLFDDILNLFVRREITACGMTGMCQVQSVIEADGSVFPCDFYVLDEYCLGNITEESLQTISTHQRARSFFCSRPVVKEYCKGCPYVNYCNGGCKRMSNAMYVSSNETMCGYQDLLNKIVPDIPEILVILNNLY